MRKLETYFRTHPQIGNLPKLDSEEDEEEEEVDMRKLETYLRMDPQTGNRITGA
jgi:hypothetical protein